MQALFTLTVLCEKKLVVYTISQFSQNKYYARAKDANMESFTLLKCAEVWISDAASQLQAVQIGKKIDRLTFVHDRKLKIKVCLN